MRWMTLALAVLAGLLVVQLAVRLRSLGAAKTAAVRENPVAPVPFQWPAIAPGLWKVFRAATPPPAVPAAGSLASRYRLAGVPDPDRSPNQPEPARHSMMQTNSNIWRRKGNRWTGPRGDVAMIVVLSDGARRRRCIWRLAR